MFFVRVMVDADFSQTLTASDRTRNVSTCAARLDIYTCLSFGIYIYRFSLIFFSAFGMLRWIEIFFSSRNSRIFRKSFIPVYNSKSLINIYFHTHIYDKANTCSSKNLAHLIRNKCSRYSSHALYAHGNILYSSLWNNFPPVWKILSTCGVVQAENNSNSFTNSMYVVCHHNDFPRNIWITFEPQNASCLEKSE